MPNPHGEVYDELTQNGVDNDGQERHTISENEKIELVISISFAYLFSLTIPGVVLTRLDILLCFITTETLQNDRVLVQLVRISCLKESFVLHI